MRLLTFTTLTSLSRKLLYNNQQFDTSLRLIYFHKRLNIINWYINIQSLTCCWSIRNWQQSAKALVQKDFPTTTKRIYTWSNLVVMNWKKNWKKTKNRISSNRSLRVYIVNACKSNENNWSVSVTSTSCLGELAHKYVTIYNLSHQKIDSSINKRLIELIDHAEWMFILLFFIDSSAISCLLQFFKVISTVISLNSYRAIVNFNTSIFIVYKTLYVHST